MTCSHRLAQQQRAAEIAMQQIAIPMRKLRQQRLVEPEIVADLGDLLRRGAYMPAIAAAGIAGNQVDHAEGDQADDQQDRHRTGQPAQDRSAASYRRFGVSP